MHLTVKRQRNEKHSVALNLHMIRVFIFNETQLKHLSFLIKIHMQIITRIFYQLRNISLEHKFDAN